MKNRKIMKCIKIKQYGKAENLVYENEKVPSISDHEVLINVKAIGVNRPDILQRLGLYYLPWCIINSWLRSFWKDSADRKKVKILK